MVAMVLRMQCCLRHVAQCYIKQDSHKPVWLKQLLHLTPKVFLAKYFKHL